MIRWIVESSLQFRLMVIAIAVALIMALLASIIPARQAAKVKIIQALQYE